MACLHLVLSLQSRGSEWSRDLLKPSQSLAQTQFCLSAEATCGCSSASESSRHRDSAIRIQQTPSKSLNWCL